MEGMTGIPAPRIRSLEELKGRSGDDPEAIRAVAKELESLFAYELIKAMRETSGLSGTGGFGKDAYLGMFDLELSKLFAERGLGLQDLFVKQLTATAEKAGRQTDGRSAPRGSAEMAVRTILPAAEAARVSSGYGMRQDPFTAAETLHHGIDIAAPAGAEIHPVQPGTVVFSGEQAGYGNVVVIDHGNGFRSRYAHNSENTVRTGDAVETGTVIARVGSSGRSTGPHVHVEIQFQGKTVPPETLLRRG